MAKRYRRLQHISTIPILAALLLTQNPSAAVRNRVDDTAFNDNSADISIQMDVSDTRLRNR